MALFLLPGHGTNSSSSSQADNSRLRPQQGCDRIPVCQGCNKFDRHNLRDYGVLDTRFDLFLCKKLDAISRADWKQVTEKQFEKYKKQLDIATGQIAKTHSLASSDRTSNDDREVQQRKAEVEAISPQEWKAMNESYLVGKKDE